MFLSKIGYKVHGLCETKSGKLLQLKTMNTFMGIYYGKLLLLAFF